MQANRIDSDWEGVKGDLQRIRDTLLQRRGALVNLTADDHTLSTLRPHLDDFLSSLPAESAQPTSWGQMLQPCNEAITVPTQVGLMPLHVLECCCSHVGLLTVFFADSLVVKLPRSAWDLCPGLWCKSGTAALHQKPDSSPRLTYEVPSAWQCLHLPSTSEWQASAYSSVCYQSCDR